MPPPDPTHDERRAPREARLYPNATEVARVRALLSEIERRVFGAARPGGAGATTGEIAHTVDELFGDG